MNTPDHKQPNELERPKRWNPFELLEKLSEIYNRQMDRLFGLADLKSSPDYNVFLPDSIRYKIRYDVQLLRDDIENLLHSSHWQDEAIYLLVKSLDDQPEVQEQCIQETLSLMRSGASASEVQTTLEKYRLQIAKDQAVNGTKLAQISRAGPHRWKEQADDLAADIKQDDAVPCLIAYSTFTIVRAFIEAANNGDKFMIVMKHRVEADKDHCLFVITCHEDSCTVEEWTHYEPHEDIKEIHLVDDTMRTGGTLASTRECLNKRYGDFFPDIKEKDYYMVLGVPWTGIEAVQPKNNDRPKKAVPTIAPSRQHP